MVKDVDCIWEAPVLDVSGCANAARNTVLSLHDMGATVRLAPTVGWSHLASSIPPDDMAVLKRMIRRPLIDGVPSVSMLPPDLYSYRWGRGGTQIGHTVFEVSGIPDDWVVKLNLCDEVWTPTTFNRDVFASSGVDKNIIKVLPQGVNAAKFQPTTTPIKFDGIADDTFVFLSVFQWTIRKGWDVLLDAYFEEFDKSENVCLVIKTYEAQPGDPDADRVVNGGIQYVKDLIGDRKKDNFPALLWYKKLVPDNMMPSLYEACDSFVLPTRGEGWNLPGIEAMSMGKPVICTRWSGHLDFMTEYNSYLIDVENVGNDHSGEMDEIHYGYRGKTWAQPSVRHLRHLMRHVYENREHAKKIGAQARADILANWTWEHSASKIYERLEELM